MLNLNHMIQQILFSDVNAFWSRISVDNTVLNGAVLISSVDNTVYLLICYLNSSTVLTEICR